MYRQLLAAHGCRAESVRTSSFSILKEQSSKGRQCHESPCPEHSLVTNNPLLLRSLCPSRYFIFSLVWRHSGPFPSQENNRNSSLFPCLCAQITHSFCLLSLFWNQLLILESLLVWNCFGESASSFYTDLYGLRTWFTARQLHDMAEMKFRNWLISLRRKKCPRKQLMVSLQVLLRIQLIKRASA